MAALREGTKGMPRHGQADRRGAEATVDTVPSPVPTSGADLRGPNYAV